MISSEYVSAYMGKWHLGDEIIPQHGFDHWVSMEDHYRLFFTKKEYLSHFSDYYHFLNGKGYEPDIEWGGTKIFSRGMAANLPQELSKNAFLGHEASQFIKENSHRPFVLYVGFMDPHSPLPDRPSSMYNPDTLPTEPHFLRKPPSNASQRHQKAADYYMSRSNVEGEDLRTKDGWLRLQARYWEAISMVDQSMSIIFDALVESNVADNTIVVFTTDHGDMMGAHGMRTFTFLYQESFKVPLLLRVPWMAKEQTLIRGHMSHIDLVPTLLDLMEEPIPSHLQGKSLVPVLRGETTLEKNAVFVETNGPSDRVPMVPGGGYPWPSWQPWRTVISGDGWKLNLSTADQCELYDLNSDTTEETNLFDDPSQKERIRHMTSLLKQWQEETGDNGPLPDV